MCTCLTIATYPQQDVEHKRPCLARCETAGKDSIVVLSCFILCLCLGCPLM